MEFVFDVALAKKAIAYIFDIAPAKSQDGLPLGVKILASVEGVVFSINGADLFAKSGVVAEVIEEGQAVVGLLPLFKAISGFSPLKDGLGTNSIKVKSGGQNLTITAKTVYKSKIVNQRRSLSFFDRRVAELQIISEDKFIKLPVGNLVQGIRSVLLSSSGSGDATIFSGALLEVSKNKIKTVGMNGVTLTEFSCSLSADYDTFSCVLDSSYLARINKLLAKLPADEESLVDVLISDRMFVIKYERLLVGMSVMSSKFPDYSSVLETKRKSIVMDSEIFLDNLRNVMFSSDKEDDFRVTLNFYEGELIIKTPTCENDGIPIVSGIDTNVHIDFNIHLLEACVRNLGAPVFSLSYKDRYSPVVFVPQDDEAPHSMLTIVAPLK